MMGKHAKMNASLEGEPIKVVPEILLGTIQPITAAMIAGRKTYRNILDRGISSACTGFFTSAYFTAFRLMARMIIPMINPTPAAANAYPQPYSFLKYAATKLQTNA